MPPADAAGPLLRADPSYRLDEVLPLLSAGTPPPLRFPDEAAESGSAEGGAWLRRLFENPQTHALSLPRLAGAALVLAALLAALLGGLAGLGLDPDQPGLPPLHVDRPSTPEPPAAPEPLPPPPDGADPTAAPDAPEQIAPAAPRRGAPGREGPEPGLTPPELPAPPPDPPQQELAMGDPGATEDGLADLPPDWEGSPVRGSGDRVVSGDPDHAEVWVVPVGQECGSRAREAGPFAPGDRVSVCARSLYRKVEFRGSVVLFDPSKAPVEGSSARVTAPPQPVRVERDSEPLVLTLTTAGTWRLALLSPGTSTKAKAIHIEVQGP